MTPEDRQVQQLTQSAHAQELRSVRILTKTLGISRSQARHLVRLQRAQETQPKDANAGNRNANLFEPGPRQQIQRRETVVDLPVVGHIAQPAIVPPPIPPFNVGGGLTDAPSDTKLYGRKDAAWVEVVVTGLIDAPNNGFVYGRLNATWVTVPEEAPTGTTVWGRKESGATPGTWLWTAVPEEAPSTGSRYRRYNLTWEVDPIDEIPAPGLFLRSMGAWYSFVDALDDEDIPNTSEVQILISTAITTDDSARNPIGLAAFAGTFSNPPTQAECQDLASYVNTLKAQLDRA